MRREVLNESEFMEIIFIIITALLPVVVLLYFINFKDKASPEPKSQLAKGVLYGMISAPLSFCLSIPLGLLGFYAEDSEELLDRANAIGMYGHLVGYGPAVKSDDSLFLNRSTRGQRVNCIYELKYGDRKLRGTESRKCPKLQASTAPTPWF